MREVVREVVLRGRGAREGRAMVVEFLVGGARVGACGWPSESCDTGAVVCVCGVSGAVVVWDVDAVLAL